MIVYYAESKCGKVYVGCTSRVLQVRKNEHKSHALKGLKPGKFYDAIRDYGIEYFSFNELVKASSLPEMYYYEQCFISLFDSTTVGYNWTLGGRSNKASKVTQNVRKAASENARKNLSNKKIRAKMKANSLTSDKQRKRTEIWNLKRKNSLPKFEVFEKVTGRSLGVFQGYKETSLMLGYSANTLRTCLYRGENTSKHIFKFLEV